VGCLLLGIVLLKKRNRPSSSDTNRPRSNGWSVAGPHAATRSNLSTPPESPLPSPRKTQGTRPPKDTKRREKPVSPTSEPHEPRQDDPDAPEGESSRTRKTPWWSHTPALPTTVVYVPASQVTPPEATWWSYKNEGKGGPEKKSKASRAKPTAAKKSKQARSKSKKGRAS
jgi:hypothetical protein